MNDSWLGGIVGTIASVAFQTPIKEYLRHISDVPEGTTARRHYLRVSGEGWLRTTRSWVSASYWVRIER